MEEVSIFRLSHIFFSQFLTKDHGVILLDLVETKWHKFLLQRE
jgi:hypothetical protein